LLILRCQKGECLIKFFWEDSTFMFFYKISFASFSALF
jgi:hypothetical protein